MNNLISVITPVHPRSIGYLGEAYVSLRRQELPPGWAWEWIVQEDGTTGAVAAALPDDDRIRVGLGRRGGPGTARTLALGRSNGDLIKVLDADDQLTPSALARDIDMMVTHPDIGWTTSRVLDLFPDGSTAGFEDDPPEGRLLRQHVFDYWISHNYRVPVHPATLCIRRDLVLALGGWMALPASEDTGLLIAASVISAGYFIAEAGLLYRKWDGQETAQAAHTESAEWNTRMSIIEARARALADIMRRCQGCARVRPVHG